MFIIQFHQSAVHLVGMLPIYLTPDRRQLQRKMPGNAIVLTVRRTNQPDRVGGIPDVTPETVAEGHYISLRRTLRGKNQAGSNSPAAGAGEHGVLEERRARYGSGR
jgi:hypothetical protein